MTTQGANNLDIPDIIVDPQDGTKYTRGIFLGKGSFAKCYEITDIETKINYAGKIIPKKILAKQSSREKVVQEINIHKSLNHKNVVGFHGFFESGGNMVIVLELCKRRSMMELQRRRKKLTEPEARFYLHQLLQGVQYLHEQNIIHRDLKLGNLFLNDNLEVKLGDLGFAVKIEFQGERRMTNCGTPNYVAPEILNKVGHSFEVDIWSIGCILYTLLFGKPPFETSSLKETYKRIRNCDYNLTDANISVEAASLIRSMLQPDPKDRPTVQMLLKDKYFTSGYMPRELPVTCLSVEPRFESALLAHANKGVSQKAFATQSPNKGANPGRNPTSGSHLPSRRPLSQVNGIDGRGDAPEAVAAVPTVMQNNLRYMHILKEQLSKLLKTQSLLRPNASFVAEGEDPAAQALFWVSNWVDYTDRYGFGYQLSDESFAMVFNDGTKLIMLANETDLHYIEQDGSEHYHKTHDYPSALNKKFKLLGYFKCYMMEELVRAGGRQTSPEADNMARMPYVSHFFRSPNNLTMFLTNGTLQINFANNHNKLIICPLMEAVTHITTDNVPHTYRFSTISAQGCSKDLYQGLKTAKSKISSMILAVQDQAAQAHSVK